MEVRATVRTEVGTEANEGVNEGKRGCERRRTEVRGGMRTEVL